MVLKLIKLLFREIFIGKLIASPFHFFNQELGAIKEQLSKKLTEFLLKLLLGILIVSLFMLACLFGFLALGIYLNHLLDSDYKGFLIVAVGCGLFALLGLLLSNLFHSNTSSERKT